MSIVEALCCAAGLALLLCLYLIAMVTCFTLLGVMALKIYIYCVRLFAKLLEKRIFDGGGGAPVAVSAPAGGVGVAATPAAVPAAEEEKEEPKESDDEEMGFSLLV